MERVIKITTNGGSIEVDRALYGAIFEASIISNHPDYITSLKESKISLSIFMRLCREGGLAYALFFGQQAVVGPLVEKESSILFGGFGGQFSIGVRGRTFNLNVIRLLVKDIKLKQETIARFVKTKNNPHVKYLKNSSRPLQDQADYIVQALGIDMQVFRGYKDKREALLYLIERAEANNIFISIENTGTNMPQNFKRAGGLTGVYIKHGKFPYIFISKEGMSDPDKTPARKIFTLMYLLVCLFKGQSKMVTLDQTIRQNDTLFELTEIILMPTSRINRRDDYSLEDLDGMASELNVSPGAILTRLDHLRYIAEARRDMLRDMLSQRYAAFFAQQKQKNEKNLKEFKHNRVNNIRIYQGKAFLRILKDQYIAGNIQRKEIHRQLSYRTKGSVELERVFDSL